MLCDLQIHPTGETCNTRGRIQLGIAVRSTGMPRRLPDNRLVYRCDLSPSRWSHGKNAYPRPLLICPPPKTVSMAQSTTTFALIPRAPSSFAQNWGQRLGWRPSQEVIRGTARHRKILQARRQRDVYDTTFASASSNNAFCVKKTGAFEAHRVRSRANCPPSVVSAKERTNADPQLCPLSRKSKRSFRKAKLLSIHRPAA